MNRSPRKFGAALVLSVVLGLGLLGMDGCGMAEGTSSHVLSTSQAKHLFLQLPYHYEFRHVPLPEGASGALAGKAITKHGTFLNFGVALGRHPEGVPVPRSGTEESYGYSEGGFVYTDDLLIPGKHHHWHSPPRIHTEAQAREVGHIEVEMEEKLCRAATGKPCPP